MNTKKCWINFNRAICLMNLIVVGVLTTAGLHCPLTHAASQASAKPKPVVKDKVIDKFTPAGLGQQKIEGLLGQKMQLNLEKRLLAIDEDILLGGYVNRPGRHEWIGEHVGKFMHASCNILASTQDERLKAKLDRTVRSLIHTQKPDGYLGTYLDKDRWTRWDVWSHKYNLIGLLSYYKLTGYLPALESSRKIGDLLCKVYGDGPGKKDIITKRYHVGMASTSVLGPMAELYRYTGEQRYLDFCYYITRSWDQPHGPKIIKSLRETGSVRKTANAKAYEMMSNLVGLVELYRLTGDETFIRPVLIAWKDIVTKRLYVTGTTSWDEFFRDDFDLKAVDENSRAGVGEGCATVTWLQMNWHLLRLTGEPQYAEQLERTVYNALIGAQHPQSGNVCYFTPLIGKKPYGAISDGAPGITCCSSSLPRGVSMLPEMIWGTKAKGIAVNFYTAGKATITVNDGKENLEVALKSTTRFPQDGHVVLTLEPSRAAQFPLSLRVPAWCSQFTVTVNGQSWQGKPDEYLVIDRTWQRSNQVEINMDMSVQVLPGGKSYPKSVAIQRGPQILAFDTTLNKADMNLAGLKSTDLMNIKLREDAKHLPKGWVGNQAYALNGVLWNQEAVKEQKELILVPYSDASQKEGDTRVWLIKDIGN